MLLCVCCVQILQPDMWGVVPSDRHDWATLRADIKQYEFYDMLFAFFRYFSQLLVDISVVVTEVN